MLNRGYQHLKEPDTTEKMQHFSYLIPSMCLAFLVLCRPVANDRGCQHPISFENVTATIVTNT
uniref:Uncharacterized protein n=1 Tax=Magallana gigas TaxID=29159 RepID=K1R4J7_MAGGI